jgi:hypothetical protein
VSGQPDEFRPARPAGLNAVAGIGAKELALMGLDRFE